MIVLLERAIMEGENVAAIEGWESLVVDHTTGAEDAGEDEDFYGVLIFHGIENAVRPEQPPRVDEEELIDPDSDFGREA